MIRVCSQCGQQNRIPSKYLASRGKCGACKTPFGPNNQPIAVDQAEFDDIIHNATVPVLVDFWAEWCGPCRMVAPEVKKIAETMAGRAVVLKVDTELHPQLAQRYGVQGIPNFIVFKSGRVFSQQAGAVRSTEMQRWLENAGA